MDIAAIERLLDEAFAAERFEAAASNVVYPALRAIGEDWAEGTIDVAMEHAASETIRRRLARFYDAAVDLSSPLDVIVGLPPGLPARDRRDGLRRRRAPRRAERPVPRRERARAQLGPDRRCGRRAGRGRRGRSSIATCRAATDVVTSLLASAGRPAVFVGGRAASAVAEATGVTLLPARMDAAVDLVRERLRETRTP